MAKHAKKWMTAVVVLIIAVVGGGFAWKYLHQSALPESLASGNGRIEATEVDIATKYAGRLVDILAREGDMVEAGKVLAHMDTDELEAQMREAEAELRRAREDKKYTAAVVSQRESELVFAQKELKRSLKLVKNGNVPREKVDQDQTNEKTAKAALQAANIKVVVAEAAIQAAIARTERLKTQIDDSTLNSPMKGRVIYRLAEPGEVLAAGGKVLTVLDLTDVYMTIFLPTTQAGKVDVGSDARILLDALPDVAIPARVSFIAARAQFTPREVETRTEREKLMFRVKVKIDPQLLEKHIEKVKTGLPGVAYVQLDSNAQWPESLQPPPDLQ